MGRGGMLRSKDIRLELYNKFKNQDFTIDKTGVKTIELIGYTWLADRDYIVRKPNVEYIERELQWYRSQSRNVYDIPGTVPKIWKQVATPVGQINSNYGWCIWSEENGNQYNHVLAELKEHPNSRRAVMIYNRPSMHVDYSAGGMSDFICTMYNAFYIRDGKLISHYVMRSQDLIFGYNNDRAWAKYVQNQLAKDLDVETGDLIWTASNAHVYERHFEHIVEAMSETVV